MDAHLRRLWRYQHWAESTIGLRHPAHVPDFDCLDAAALRSWIAGVQGGRITAMAVRCFPGRPPQYLTAFRLLYSIAHYQLAHRPWGPLYKRLPEWAKWRERFPVEACLREGQQKLKKPKRSNPLRLLDTKGLLNG